MASRTKAPSPSQQCIQFCTKNNRSCPRNHQVVQRLRLISFEISCNAKSIALISSQSIPKTDPLADYRILNTFETRPQSPGLSHSKHSIGNIGIRPIKEYLFLFLEKQRWPFQNRNEIFTHMIHLYKKQFHCLFTVAPMKTLLPMCII